MWRLTTAGKRVLNAAGKIATGPCPSCTPTSDCTGVSYAISAFLNWTTTHDLDLYGQMDAGAVCYFNAPAGGGGFRRVAGGLTLNGDVYPNCASTFEAPEVIELWPLGSRLSAAHTFRFWWNKFSDCNPVGFVAGERIEVTNYGTANICVNGVLVRPTETWVNTAIVSPGVGGDQSAYTGGTIVEVKCAV